MKKFNLIVLFLLIAKAMFGQEPAYHSLPYTQEPNFFKAQRKMDKHFRSSLEEIKGGSATANEKQQAAKEIEEFAEYKRWENFWRDRVKYDGNYPSAGFLYTEFLKRSTSSPNLFTTATNWTNISQTTNTGGYFGMGRTTCTAYHPTDSNIFYVGSPNGGIWKTDDGGFDYIPLGDNLPFVSAGVILVDPVNPDILYVSSGDAVGWWNYNAGIYKSIDGGLTWLPTGLVWQLSAQKAIYNMVFEPGNSSTIYIASTGGLYKSSNAGLTFNIIKTGSVNDIKFKPGSSTELYITIDDYWNSSEVYYSNNSGTSFSKISNFNTNYNFLKLAVTPANPNLLGVYASVNDKVFMSFNSGSTFNLQCSNAPGNGAFFISPINANDVYCGGVDVARSTNAGVNWTTITKWYNAPPLPEVHADLHNISYNPLHPNDLYFNNDGGLYVLNVPSNTWLELSEQLIITQFYSVANSQTNSDFIIGGIQDNGGVKRFSPGFWGATNGGDAMETAVDPVNDNIIYTTYILGQLYRSNDKWTADTYHDITPKDNFGNPLEGEWVTPYSLNPKNRTTIFAAYSDVYKSTNRGDTWTAISQNLTSGNKLQALAIAPSDSQVIYTCRDNILYSTTNSGSTWANITLSGSERITSILVHPTQPNTIWLSRAGFGAKVFKSINGGLTFQNVSGSLPNVPANCLFYEPGSINGIYVGTDLGVFYINDTLANWVSFNNGLPAVPVTDFSIYLPTNKLRVATYGRGLWETDLYAAFVGIKENISQSSTLIYPNPANESFTINNANSFKDENTEVNVLDLQGRLIFNSNDNRLSDTKTIYTKSWENGVYIVQLINSSKIISNNKLIIQH